MSDNDLREALAKIKPGDEVTVALDCAGHGGTVTGKAWRTGANALAIVDRAIRFSNGNPGGYVTAVLDHKPHVPEVTADDLDALPVWAVVTTDKGGHTWTKHENGLWNGHMGSTNLARHYDTLTIRHPKEA